MAQHQRRHLLLTEMGARARRLRIQRGLCRKVVAELAGVSERQLGNLERGIGNVSILFLQQLALALQCTLAELLEGQTAASSEWIQLRKLLRGSSECDLHRARLILADLFDGATLD